jgi:hypothetical protein
MNPTYPQHPHDASPFPLDPSKRRQEPRPPSPDQQLTRVFTYRQRRKRGRSWAYFSPWRRRRWAGRRRRRRGGRDGGAATRIWGWIDGAVYIEVRFARGVEVLLDLECPSTLGLRHAWPLGLLGLRCELVQAQRTLEGSAYGLKSYHTFLTILLKTTCSHDFIVYRWKEGSIRRKC